jgi:hypothetical protein
MIENPRLDDLLRRLVRYLHSDEYERRMADNEIDSELQDVLEKLDRVLGETP